MPDFDIQPYDEAVISGISSSPAGVHYTNLECTVATVDDNDGDVKVWPAIATERDGGKIWFPRAAITKYELRHRDTD